LGTATIPTTVKSECIDKPKAIPETPLSPRDFLAQSERLSISYESNDIKLPMSAEKTTQSNKDTQAHALGTYRHDVAYTAALKSQCHALGSYRYDIAYTGALKSVQQAACMVSTTGMSVSTESYRTGVELLSAPVLFCACAGGVGA
jgi:hypothetical protein